MEWRACNHLVTSRQEKLLRLSTYQAALANLGSISKTFVGYAILLLRDEGKLSLDDTLGKLLPDLPAAWHGIMVRQLLGHISGLPDVIVDQRTGQWIADTQAEALKKVTALPMQFPPGTSWSYNQTNYMLLGMLIDRGNLAGGTLGFSWMFSAASGVAGAVGIFYYATAARHPDHDHHVLSATAAATEMVAAESDVGDMVAVPAAEDELVENTVPQAE
jgi:hypothetical protein